MAVEYPEITQSNRELLEHILTDLHDVARKVDVLDKALEDFRPLLNQFRSPLAGGMAARRARRTSGRTEVQ